MLLLLSTIIWTGTKSTNKIMLQIKGRNWKCNGTSLAHQGKTWSAESSTHVYNKNMEVMVGQKWSRRALFKAYAANGKPTQKGCLTQVVSSKQK